MIFINAVYKENVYPKYMAENFIKMLNPIAPYITEDLWEKLGHKETIAYEPWPSYDETKIVDTSYEMVIQVCGKVRGKITVSKDISKEQMESLAKENENVQKFIEGKTIVKIIVIPEKLVNIVVK